MMNYKFYLTCPNCKRDSEYTSDEQFAPHVQCADCLLDNAKIVEMRVVAFEPLPVLSQ